MSINLDPDQKGYVVLRADANNPLPRTLTLRKSPTAREAIKLQDELDLARKATDRDCINQLLAIINNWTIGWINFRASDGTAMDFNQDAIADVLNVRQLWEVAHSIVSPLTESDLKNFESQRTLDAASSVAAA